MTKWRVFQIVGAATAKLREPYFKYRAVPFGNIALYGQEGETAN